MKIIVLILGYHHEICYNYIKTIEKTWGTSTNSNINIIYSFGGSNTNSFDGKIINVVDEDYGAKNTYKKLLSVLEVAYNNLDFDIITQLIPALEALQNIYPELNVPRSATLSDINNLLGAILRKAVGDGWYPKLCKELDYVVEEALNELGK